MCWVRSAFIFLTVCISSFGQSVEVFRPPAVPLVTHDPYFSLWSFNDRLTDGITRHWTGAEQEVSGLIRIDGKTLRFMGSKPSTLPAIPQQSLEVTPTRTIYRFEGDEIRIELGFLSPMLPQDLTLMSRPVSYLEVTVKSKDGRPHQVEIYLDCSTVLAANNRDDRVTWSRHQLGDLVLLRTGTEKQPVLEKSGDDRRIDWGYFYLAAPSRQFNLVAEDSEVSRKAFLAGGRVPQSDNLIMPRPTADHWPVLACSSNLGKVGSTPVLRRLLLAYDDQYSIEYFQRKLRPYWRSKGMEIKDLLIQAWDEYPAILERCRQFDQELTADLLRVTGKDFAPLAVLAFRQCIAAHKLVADWDGTPLFFSKENFSNGCIDTVDVTYPSSPFFLLFNPDLLKAQLTPILDYANSPRWPFRFAPHDLGTYPLANGQVYGAGEQGEENQMPVEECGNMMIMVSAIAQAERNAEFAARYWPVLTKWAEYLKEKGLDPENQLCTDDFAGHLAHNTNLSLKAIMGLRGYAMLCDLTQRNKEAQEYLNLAQTMSKTWMEKAVDGDHYRLTFDKPGTWSQKYNLVWDHLLEFDLFPDAVAQMEVAYYKTQLNKFGFPLDRRSLYTKLDWEVWSATLARDPADMITLLSPLKVFMNESPSRVPLTDWYWTNTGKQAGFQARSVVGGVYIPLLRDQSLWKKWREKATSK